MRHCRFSNAGKWELVKSTVGQNLEEAMFVYILKREIGCECVKVPMPVHQFCL